VTAKLQIVKRRLPHTPPAREPNKAQNTAWIAASKYRQTAVQHWWACKPALTVKPNANDIKNCIEANMIDWKLLWAVVVSVFSLLGMGLGFVATRYRKEGADQAKFLSLESRVVKVETSVKATIDKLDLINTKIAEMPSKEDWRELSGNLLSMTKEIGEIKGLLQPMRSLLMRLNQHLLNQP
jgi:hypothetical protein